MSKLTWLAVSLVTVIAGTLLAAYIIMPVRFYPRDPADATILFDDLDAFTKAHQAARNDNLSPDAYATHYFDKGSDAVDSLVWQVKISAQQTADDVHARPQAYDEIIKRFVNVQAAESAIRAAYEVLESTYPDAVYPPVYFAYSGFRARGLIRPYGIIIGGEYFVAGPNDRSIEGWPGARGWMVSADLLPSHLIHELAHIQHARKSPVAFLNSGSVLNWSIYEGAADFVAATLTGAHTNPAGHAFLEETGNALWCEFYRSMGASRRTYWMDSEVFGVPPGGFGASFGFEISAAYYARRKDKKQALIDLIELRDHRKIFESSGYSERLAELCAT